jgi:subtilisin family serine protease
MCEQVLGEITMTQTVLIYAGQRQRKKLAREGIAFLAEYDDYVLAEVSDEELQQLRSARYEIEVQGKSPALRVRGRLVNMEAPGSAAPEAEVHPAVQPDAAGITFLPAGPSPQYLGPGRHYYLVQFVGPVKLEWLAEIEAHGGRPEEPVPPQGYIIGLDPASYDWLAGSQRPVYVRWVGHYSVELRIDPDLIQSLAADQHAPRSRPPAKGQSELEQPVRDISGALESSRVPAAFSISFFEPEDLVGAIPRILEMGGRPGTLQLGTTITTVSFSPREADLQDKVKQLAGLHGVRSVEAFTMRQPYNDVAARLMGAREVMESTGLDLRGQGEVVGVADTGLDTGDPATIHPDFAGRIAALRSWPVSPDWSSMVTNPGGDDGAADMNSGHGTHVTGSACGDGSVAQMVQGQAIRGLAPEAKLVFQAIEQKLQWSDAYRQEYFRRYGRYPAEYGLVGLPADLNSLFQQAYDAGARVHNNSWGGGSSGAYDIYAEQVDRFMWNNKDFLVLFAAGNDGRDGNRDGIVDEGSVTPPGTAKNCLTVGAAESVRSEGGYQRPYGQLWPISFPVNPLFSDMPSDHADDVAAFSSRGQTRDGRIKPDLVAPGTNILSVRSRAVNSGSHGWGPAPVEALRDSYMFFGGTSMATPLVTGAAVLVRQYLRAVKRRRRPSAALVKATLIHAVHYRPNRFAQDGSANGRDHDFAQGWGHLDLAGGLLPLEPVQVRWYDHSRGLNTGQSWRWACNVADAGGPLEFTLAWTDYPGMAGHSPSLVNDLDLVITSPSGRTYYGNGSISDAEPHPDRTNNVERIGIPQPELGRYAIRVRAHNVPCGPQGFALVYSGGIR